MGERSSLVEGRRLVASFLPELTLIAGIPLIVLLVGLLPETFGDTLTVQSDAITMGALFGHWLVHFSRLGAAQNAAGLFVAGIFAGGVALPQGDRRWFRLAYPTVVVAVPVVTVVVDALVLPMILGGGYRTRGASAIVAAVLGIGFAGVVRYVDRTVDVRAGVTAGGIVLVGSLLVVLASSGVGIRAIAVLGSLVAIVAAGDVLARIRTDGRPPSTVTGTRVGLLIVVSVVVLAPSFLFLFPGNPFGGPGVTNVVAHATGFVVGTVIGVWGYRYWAPDSWW